MITLGNGDIVKLLIENGADVDGVTELAPRFHGTIPTNKQTALFLAAEKSKFLLQNGHHDTFTLSTNERIKTVFILNRLRRNSRTINKVWSKFRLRK